MEIQNDTSIVPEPFRRIAIAMSGGGFRAASFSLGTLAYLHYIKLSAETTGDQQAKYKTLLENVTFIASASGGTITAAVYSMFIRQGKTFQDAYAHLLKKLDGELLMNEALDKLSDNTAWTGPKSQNIINSFARAYDKLLFDEQTFAVNWRNADTVNLEVCFNATEFRRGLPFRFQTDGISTTKEKAGNKYIYFDPAKESVLKALKLGDILAASSCFPGGFEPVIFPKDFTYRTTGGTLDEDTLRSSLLVTSYRDIKVTLPTTDTIGLMDGGVDDNQGLKSTLLADERRRPRGEGFDLILVTDVASYFMDGYKVPEESEEGGVRQKNLIHFAGVLKKIKKRLANVAAIAIAVFIATLIACFIVPNQYVKIGAAFLAGISSIGFALFYFSGFINRKTAVLDLLRSGAIDAELNNIIRKKLQLGNGFSDQIISKLMGYLLRTKISVLEQMINARLSSLLVMAMDINLKQVRRLIYDEFYADRKWESVRCPNFIYELSEFNVEGRQKRIMALKLSDEEKKLLEPSPEMLTISEEAKNMGTTLWFDKNDTDSKKLKKLVSCGAYTCCMNLLEFTLLLEKKFTNDNMVKKIKKQLIDDIGRFKKEPYFLYDIYSPDR